ncbi:hypothetical protein [Streptomyces lichenis]|uniref:Uncharacterized protein n=1 Tax=Streptomyces lichenis TaxID=2306967 RepID=A0ABT0I9I7_9ACTN|nr:hypothetical protein [Streptomyces lichenis]MCK8677985.1 hypothetical protein [Streptomyces lichenis]
MDDVCPWERVAARITELREELDGRDRNQTEPERRLLRTLAIGQDSQQAAEAARAAAGASSRRGRDTHSWSDVRTELCRVITTALIALDTISGDPIGLLDTHLRHPADPAQPHRPEPTPEP